MTTIYPVILSGGSGSRLWPVSRSLYPKQFLPLLSNLPMLVETAKRFPVDLGFALPTIVSNHEHRFMVAQSLQEYKITPRAIILEPCARNTAPAIATATMEIIQHDPEALILALPSDHIIKNQDHFLGAIEKGISAAQDGYLLTFGIQPDKPETGYGYIQKGAPLQNFKGVFKIEKFVEKPSTEAAESYINQGTFSWNSGMFFFSAKHFLEELSSYSPDILRPVKAAVSNARKDMDFIRLDEEEFSNSPSISIDYAVMEQTQKGAVLPVDPGWSDIGSWTSLWEASEKDENGNTLKGDTLVKDVTNSLVFSDDDKLTAVMGVEDLIIVNNDDALLVTTQKCSQDVKAIVNQLIDLKRPEAELHSTVHRPWGTYRTTDAGENYLVKTITVYPGAILSLQYHHHRAEHWVVVKGEATVTKGDDVFTLKENESTYIPLGVTHRLENKGGIPLMMVEVQSGSYLAEDDIVRLEDVYGRRMDKS
ncbi:mannose-1-phosphate guanylyltransferase/mannose-6-phosphate isomerase [Kiloniella majae]|uniref:mannose-1-phosphate guanylyltransferase/mannose-6-phosphate isomerase n=1 Tax=Kiloniella majae TaxID=1938558 RepID=UPI000A277094|nr:mannose-1-phosphate guanylyltransferase/mannose-6-phosphate isomerase [Kiloniella majae]